MGSKKFTLLELHVDGNPQFGPKRIGEAVFGGDDRAAPDDEPEHAADGETGEDEAGGSGKPIAALVGLVALVGVAFAVKKLRGGDEDDAETFEPAEEPDVVVN